MDAFDVLKGNERTKEYFRFEIGNGSLAHAYILEGVEGSGKHTLAYAVATALAGDTPAGARILKGQSPDVKVFGISGEKKQLTVDVVRALREDAMITPNDLPFKFYIIENAEMMNVQAQNAALKLLEEPPASTYFFLLAQSAPMLLPTVRSRAPVIRMERFSTETLGMYLREQIDTARARGASKDYIDECLKYADGCFGRAAMLLAGKNEKESDLDVKELFGGNGSVGIIRKETELLLYVQKLSNKRQELDGVLSLLQTALRDILLVRCGGNGGKLLCFGSEEEAREAGRALAKESIMKMFDLVTLLREDLMKKNVNVQNAKMTLATGLYRAAVS